VDALQRELDRKTTLFNDDADFITEARTRGLLEQLSSVAQERSGRGSGAAGQTPTSGAPLRSNEVRAADGSWRRLLARAQQGGLLLELGAGGR
jgi:hypothetical protein